ncbi:MAG: ThiF family adenylyltransferase [Armatimonadota bacterium]
MQWVEIEADEDRYSRLRMIPWWDQEVLARARVMVIGAGALGNEIIKNLALLGAGQVLVVDFDFVETSNLSRSVLFRSEDESRSKATAACESARRINSDCRFFALHADVTRDVGLGVFRWADVVICGLDSREARLAVNRACWKVTRPWVDGATEAVQGIARTFLPPDGVCYECTLGEHDRRIMAARDSCGFLAREAYRRGGTPTTPTTSAVIAGIEVQEAVKILHRDAQLPKLVGKGFFFDGLGYDCFTIDYFRREDCLSHETYESIVESDLAAETATLADVRAAAAPHVGEGATIELPSEMVTALRCSRCGSSETFFQLVRSVGADAVRCPDCGSERVPDVAVECAPGAPFDSIPLARLGFGIMDILQVRSGGHAVQIEVSADARKVFAD